MSEAVMHIESKGKINKSEAIRQAMDVLGNDAPSKDIQAHAAKLAGTEIDIRAVYQMKSNLRADKAAPKKAPKAAKPEKSKPIAKKIVRQEKKAAAGSYQVTEFFTKLGEIKQLISFFGGKSEFLNAVDQIA